MNVQHSSRSDSWRTPVSILVRVRWVLGDITLDPASSVEANEVVSASNIFTKEDDGLLQSWKTNGRSMFINPPGGKTGNKSNTSLFWKKLMEHRLHDQGFDHAIFLAFSAEAMQTTQGKGCKSICEFPFCVPAKRIRFVGEDESMQAPSHSNLIVYVPGRRDETDSFYDTFKDLGCVLNVKRCP